MKQLNIIVKCIRGNDWINRVDSIKGSGMKHFRGKYQMNRLNYVPW